MVQSILVYIHTFTNTYLLVLVVLNHIFLFCNEDKSIQYEIFTISMPQPVLTTKSKIYTFQSICESFKITLYYY